MKINGKEYEILDTLESATLADSFLKENKIGKGHGEAKLYVGNVGEKIDTFFDDFDINCFFYKRDFKTYLEDAKQEYYEPQQQYVRISDMGERYIKYCKEIDELKDEILEFNIYRADVEPPRVYINARSKYWTIMRKIGLPNISYVSIMKLKDEDGNIWYYFKMFVDYKSGVVEYQTAEEKNQEKEIEENKEIKEEKKQEIIKARVGQGKYRQKLLEECPYCPFTLVTDERLLIASHIKPWSKANNKEKTDPKNGIMLTPTYDRLFDRGFISFDDNKRLMVSPWISPLNQRRLGIFNGKVIDKLPLDNKRKKYLKYHRENIFKGS